MSGICALTNKFAVIAEITRQIDNYKQNHTEALDAENASRAILHNVQSNIDKNRISKDLAFSLFLRFLFNALNLSQEKQASIFNEGYKETVDVDIKENAPKTEGKIDVDTKKKVRPLKSYDQYCSNDLIKQNFLNSFRRSIVLLSCRKDGRPVSGQSSFNASIYDYLKNIQDKLNAIISQSDKSTQPFVIVDGQKTDGVEIVRLRDFITTKLNINNNTRFNVAEKSNNDILLFNYAYTLINFNHLLADNFKDQVSWVSKNGRYTYNMDGFYDKQTFSLHDFEDVSRHTNGILSTFFNSISIYSIRQDQRLVSNFINSVVNNNNISNAIARAIINNPQEIATLLEYGVFGTEDIKLSPKQQIEIYNKLITDNLLKVRSTLSTNVINSLIGTIYSAENDNTIDFLFGMFGDPLNQFKLLMDYVYNNQSDFFNTQGRRTMFNALYHEVSSQYKLLSVVSKNEGNYTVNALVPALLLYTINYFQKITSVSYNQSTQQKDGSYTNKKLELNDLDNVSFGIMSTIESCGQNVNMESIDPSMIDINMTNGDVTIITQKGKGNTFKIPLDPNKDIQFLKDGKMTKVTSRNFDEFKNLFCTDEDVVWLYQNLVHTSLQTETLDSAISKFANINTVRLLGLSYLNYQLQTREFKVGKKKYQGLLIVDKTEGDSAKTINEGAISDFVNAKAWLSTKRGEGSSSMYKHENKSLDVSKVSYATDAMKQLSNEIYTSNPSYVKSYVKNAENNNMAVTHIGSLMDRIKVILAQNRDYPIVGNSLFSNAGFKWTIDLLTFVKNIDQTSKSVAKFSTSENAYFMFVNGFLNSQIKDPITNKYGDYMFLPITFSDKPSIFNIRINPENVIEYIDGGKKQSVSLQKATPRQLLLSLFLSMGNKISYVAYANATEMAKVLHEYIVMNSGILQLGHEEEVIASMLAVLENNKASNTTERIKFYNNVYSILEQLYLDTTDLYLSILSLQKKGENVTLLLDNAYSVNKKGRIQQNQNLSFTIKRFTDWNIFDQCRKLDLSAAVMFAQEDSMQTIDANGNKKPEFKNITKLAAFYDEDGNQYKIHDSAKEKFASIFGFEYGEEKTNKIPNNIWDTGNKFHVAYRIQLNEDNEITDIFTESNVTIDNVNNINDPTNKLIVNPDFNKFVDMGSLVSNEFLIATVGLQYIHPNKYNVSSGVVSVDQDNIVDYIKQNAKSTVAMIKRMVIYGATGHTQLNNLLNGCSKKIKVAVFYDPKTKLVTINGDTHNQDHDDGSIRVDPLFLREYENSLPELQHEVIASKPITFVALPRFGSSQLYKCANHAITNSLSRKSMSYAADKIKADRMLRKMWNIPFLIPNIDLTKYGNRLSGQYYLSSENQNVLYVLNVEFVDSTFNGTSIDNNYVVTIKNIDTNETITKDVVINTIYDLYQVLGGNMAGEYYPNQDRFEFSESNIDKIFNIMNSVIFPRTGEELANIQYRLNAIDGVTPDYVKWVIKQIKPEFTKTEAEIIGQVPSQETFFLPVKQSRISWAANQSALKVSAANVNPVNVLTEDDGDFIHSVIDIQDMRNQLNAGHDVNESHIKEMTQVMTALTEMGYSHNDVRKVYELIGTYIIESLREYGITGEVPKEQMYDIVMKSLKASINGGTFGDISLAQAFIQIANKALIDAKKEGFKLNKLGTFIPASDPQFSGVFTTTIASKISQEVIRRTFPGIAAVLSPSQNMVTLYDFVFTYEGGKTVNATMAYDELLLFWRKESKSANPSLEYQNSNGSLQAFLANQDKLVEAGEVEIGDVVDIIQNINGTEISKTLIVEDFAPMEETPIEDIKGEYRGGKIGLQYIKYLRGRNDVKIIKRRSAGRNLKNKNQQFSVELPIAQVDGIVVYQPMKFDIYDIDSLKIATNSKLFLSMFQYIKQLSQFSPELRNYLTPESFKSELENNEALSEIINEGTIPEDVCINMINDFIDIYSSMLDEYRNKFGAYSSLNQYIERANYSDMLDQLKRACKWYMTVQLDNIKHDRFLIPVDVAKKFGVEYKYYSIEPGSSTYSSYECMLPNMLQKKLNIQKGTSIGEIVNNPDFFLQQVTKNRETPIDKNKYDLRFISKTGRHLHVIFDTEANKDIIREIQNESKLIDENDVVYDDDDTMYRVIDGELAYPISDEMQIYSKKTTLGMLDFVIIDPESILWLSFIYDSNYFDLIEHNYNQNNSEYLVLFDKYNLIGLFKNNNEPDIQEHIQYVNNYESNIKQQALEIARLMHTSFCTYINSVISARIPAQGQQSFMDMKIAGFIDVDTNVIYVPAMLLLLQGDDYDIDKSYILTATLGNNGIYTRWSPFFNYNDTNTLIASSELPIPNGIRYKSNGLGYSIKNQLNVETLKLYIERVKADADNPNVKMNIVELLAFADVLDEVYSQNSIDIAEDDDVIDLINQHTLYKMSKVQKGDATKNQIWYLMTKTCRNPQNFVAQSSPIDMSELSNAGDKSVNGKQVNYVSTSNPVSMGMMQSSNSIGKDCIGISANGAKVAGMILTANNEFIKEIVQAARSYQNTMPKVKSYETYIDGQRVDLNTKPIIDGVNWDDIFYYDENTQLKLDTEELKRIQEDVKAQGIPEDIFLAISAFISASTDNAKELILSKINSNQNFMGIYMYSVIFGIDFKTMCKFMTQPEITMLMKEATPNFFSVHKFDANIQKAVVTFTKGMQLDWFLSSKYVKSSQKLLLDICKENNLFSIEQYNQDDDKKKGKDNIYIEDLLHIKFEGNEKDQVLKAQIDQKIKDIDVLISEVKSKISDPSVVLQEGDERQKKKRSRRGEYYDGAEMDSWETGEFIEQDVYEDVIEEGDPTSIIEEDYTGQEGNISSKSSQSKKQKNLLLLYLTEQKSLLYKLKQQIPSDARGNSYVLSHMIANISVVGQMKKDSQCLLILGQMGSANQGVPGQMFEQAKKVSSINSYVNNVLEQVKDKEEYKNTEWIQNLNFDMLRFMSLTDQLQQEFIDAINLSDEIINVVDVLKHNVHFYNMWKAFSAPSTINNALSRINYKIFTEMLALKKMNLLKVINQKSQRVLTKFFFDCVINKFINQNFRNVTLTLNVGSNFYRYTNDKHNPMTLVNESKMQLNLTKEEDRRTFVNWMNTQFLSRIKNDVYKDSDFAKEMFVQSRFGNYKLSYHIDMQDKTSTQYNEIMRSFNQHINDKINEKLSSYISVDGNSCLNTLGDLIALYNLFVYKNSITSDALSNMLQAQLDNKDSLISRFFNAEGQFNINENAFSRGDYNYKDMLFTLEINGLLKPSENREVTRTTKYITYSIDDEGTKKYATVFLENAVLQLPFQNKNDVQSDDEILGNIKTFLDLYVHKISLIQKSNDCD